MSTDLYVPREHQARIEAELGRFSVLVCHRRFGKTVLSVNRLIRAAKATLRPDWRGAYIAPLYRQAKTVVWDELKRYCGQGRDECTVKFNETELRADFENGARIRLFGANNPDSLRGMYLDGVVFDEVAQMPLRIWTEVIRPALSDRKGWAMFIGTPRGKNALYEIWEKAKADRDWLAAMYRASETGIIADDELEASAREMSPEEYEQEFECSFTAAIRGAYFGQLLADADRDGRVTAVPHDPSMPVHTAWDLGMSDSTSIWFVQAKPGGTFAVIDYYEASGEGLDHYARILDAKGYKYGTHIAPHDIRVRELGTGRSRLETARSLGIRFDIAANIPIQDGINAVRTILPRCWFDEARCGPGLEALRHYRRSFNDRTADFSSRPVHDWTSHAADGFRYFAVGFRPPAAGPRPAHTANDYNPFGGNHVRS
ncbi:terminase family protein [Pseudodesulfovibrio thermohalotolerans]|uniref:terminase large subunit domain-containing protein n=1 Tax=Pseudodesulfovibrio thermohalotolerans TaxID=2880651 RepID=UPI0024424F63|nr:terminase family protein [Pseudodesulfovibrio thermohalotolerans]WFS62440.1 terminase family protein [Pseudodesulfovibrio thermohalotolerans]